MPSTVKGPEQDVDRVFSSLHKLQKQISNIMLSDNNFKSAVERVRRKQADKSNFYFGESKIIYR